jgi:hypothetical protein
MTAHWIKGSMFAAAAMLVFVSADADASKEKFVRDKPHVNIGTIGNQDAQDEKDEKDTKARDIRTEVQSKKEASKSPNDSAVEHANDKAKFKRSQGDEAGTLKGQTQDPKLRAKRISGSVGKGGKNKSKDDEDVAAKTDKSDAARARRKH